MAITKRLRVTFDVKFVCQTQNEHEITEYLIKLAKRRIAGEKLTGLDFALLEESLKTGPEGALTIAVKKSLADEVKTFGDEEGTTVSNIRFEVKR